MSTRLSARWLDPTAVLHETFAHGARAGKDRNGRCVLEERFARRRPRTRAYTEELLPDLLEGGSTAAGCSTAPARSRTPDGYRAMNDREVLTFQIKPWRDNGC